MPCPPNLLDGTKLKQKETDVIIQTSMHCLPFSTVRKGVISQHRGTPQKQHETAINLDENTEVGYMEMFFHRDWESHLERSVIQTKCVGNGSEKAWNSTHSAPRPGERQEKVLNKTGARHPGWPLQSPCAWSGGLLPSVDRADCTCEGSLAFPTPPVAQCCAQGGCVLIKLPKVYLAMFLDSPNR